MMMHLEITTYNQELLRFSSLIYGNSSTLICEKKTSKLNDLKALRSFFKSRSL